ncbi:hypothetical protein LCGC14_2703260 [marine sediment metagenome]|uniref:Uncharacterized protein n=1 Tax=marine sediment metagenome TaxID=412755 RepID=A0A0F8ZF92_9ZZZZ
MMVLLVSGVFGGDSGIAPQRVVLRANRREYMTHCLNLQVNAYSSGRYFIRTKADSADQALRDFVSRCENKGTTTVDLAATKSLVHAHCPDEQ